MEFTNLDLGKTASDCDLVNAFKFLFNSDDEEFAKDQIAKMTELEKLVLLRVSKKQLQN